MKIEKTIILLTFVIASCATNSVQTPLTKTPTIVKAQTTSTPTPEFLAGISKKAKQAIQLDPSQDSKVTGLIGEGHEFYILAYYTDKNSDIWLLVPGSGDNAWGWVKNDAEQIEFMTVEISNEEYRKIYQLASTAEFIYKPSNIQDGITWLPPKIPETRVSTSSGQNENSVPSCGSTNNDIGQFVSCKIDRAYCEYLPNTNGAPTFCNDAPYPNHNFTLIVFGQDWSDLDGQCIIISGTISMYDGKPQIITTNRAEISKCQ